MKKSHKTALVKSEVNADRLFERVVAILEEARTNVIRSVNNNMVIAYWHIGREIVEELQKGEERAEYGERVISNLSDRLNKRYGQGFSTTNLWYFRQFYGSFKNRNPEILHPMGGESESGEKLHPSGGESLTGFHPNLSWSHYRALMRVENENARDFYEIESVRCGQSSRELCQKQKMGCSWRSQHDQ